MTFSLSDIVTYSMWINIGIGIFCFKKLSPIGFKYLLFFQIFSVIADFILMNVLPTNEGYYVRCFYCFLRPVEYLVFLILFKDKINNKIIHYYLISSVVILSVFSLYSIIFNITSKSAATNGIILEGCFLLILTLLYFRSILKSKEIIILSNEPLFFVATGILFFYTTNIIATGYYHQMRIYSPTFAKSFYTLNYVFNILLSVLFSKAFIVLYKRNKTA